MPNQRVAQVSRLLHRTNTNAPQLEWQQGMVQRIRQQPNVTTSSANLQVQHSAKSKQAWKYQGHKIQRAPGLMINGTKYEDPKDPGEPRRKQESNFFITLNPNKAPNDDDIGVAEAHMVQMLKHLADERTISTYLKFGPVKDEFRNDKYADVIDHVEWKSNVEIGPQQGRQHTHIWLTVHHYSQIQINPQMMQHQAKISYNQGFARGHHLRISKRPYIHVKLLPQSDWTDIMRGYLHKGMMASEGVSYP